MKFSYAYKTSDGQRHVEEMEAPSREAVFERLRARGIKAIKVEASDGSRANGVGRRHRRWGVGRALLATAAVAVLVGVWVRARAPREPQGTETRQDIFVVAKPLPRQTIMGDRVRLETAARTTLKDPLDRFLAQFAEPGRPYRAGDRPTPAEVSDSLSSPLRHAENALTEVIDLARIVAGMKQELSSYLARGGTFDDYVAELVKRQRLECSYREKAEKRLSDLVAAVDEAKPEAGLRRAYDYWLQANAQLQAMGIYAIDLPARLRPYQLALDFVE